MCILNRRLMWWECGRAFLILFVWHLPEEFCKPSFSSLIINPLAIFNFQLWLASRMRLAHPMNLMESGAGTPKKWPPPNIENDTSGACGVWRRVIWMQSVFLTKWISCTEYWAVPPLLNGDIHACVFSFLGLPLLLFCCRLFNFFSLCLVPLLLCCL